jgi:hypothetical protein
MRMTPDAIRRLLDDLEANRRSRRNAWATLQRLRKLLEDHGARIGVPDDLSRPKAKRSIEGRDIVMRSLIRAVYRFRVRL